jgi:hypothetical protein
MPNYQKGVIYGICCRDPSVPELYIGSTTHLSGRSACHAFNCNHPEGIFGTYKIYKFINEHGGWENWEVCTLEEYPCESRQELEAREGYWVAQIKPALNMKTPGLNQKDDPKTYSRNYRMQNAEILKTKRKQNYQRNPDKFRAVAKQWYRGNKDKKREYYLANREKLLAYQKNRYKEQIRGATLPRAVAEAAAAEKDV